MIDWLLDIRAGSAQSARAEDYIDKSRGSLHRRGAGARGITDQNENREQPTTTP